MGTPSRAIHAFHKSASFMAVALMISAGSPAMSNDYPAQGKPITIIVPYPPGGPGDVVVRTLADVLRVNLNATFIIENKPGASQILATRMAARATADGYTLLLGSATSLALNPITKKSLPYDPIRDLDPISMVVNTPQYLITRPGFPANSIPELIALAKKSPGKLTYASLGPGSTANIAGELLNVWAGTSIQGVPYPGAAPALRDTVAGHIDMFYTTAVLPMIQSGQVKALGVTSAKRTQIAPEIPALSEFGMPDFDVGIWWGLLAPAGTPNAVVNLLQGAIKKAVVSGALKERMGVSSDEYELRATSPEEFREFIQDEIRKMQKIIEVAKIGVE
jgi:tripartite-type tricarboxylate transporter receptor subunit TctC